MPMLVESDPKVSNFLQEILPETLYITFGFHLYDHWVQLRGECGLGWE